ncbi:MAG: NYN domain-containing protein [Firmicutes bacterium]|nr:NYN domain-containing protein [Bacillota bacterium]
MEDRKNIALFIDIDNAKISLEVFNSILDKLVELGDIIYVKVYGFNERKHIKFGEVIEENGFDSAPTMRFKKRSKSQLDMRVIIDSMRAYFTWPHINSFCFVVGEGDMVSLLSFLRAGGKGLITVETNNPDGNDHMYSDKIVLDVDYARPSRISKKDLSSKLKDISSRSASLNEDDDNYIEQRAQIIAEIEEILSSRDEGADAEEDDMFESLQSLLDILKSSE